MCTVLDPYLNIAKIESFSKYCLAINNTRFLDIAYKDVIKDVTDSESNYFDFSKTLHRSPPTACCPLGPCQLPFRSLPASL